jgi:hypothetical protein
MTRKTCTHCLTEFTPTVTPEGPVYTDATGAECCDGCYCPVCGHGHPTTDGHETCQAEFEAGEREAVDPDAVFEALRDARIGV